MMLVFVVFCCFCCWLYNTRSSFTSHPKEEDGKKASNLKEALRNLCKSNGRLRSSKHKSDLEEKDTSHLKTFPFNNTTPNNADNNKSNAKSKSSSNRSKYSSKWSQEDLAAALMMVRNGTPIKPAAEKFNIPVMTLWRRTRALGLVSSKVQCGFRYSTSKGNTINAFNSISIQGKTLRSYYIPKRNNVVSHSRERSPLTESNFKVTQSDNSLVKCKSEFTSHKENSPDESSSSCEPPPRSQEEAHEYAADLSSNENAVMLSDQNSKVPTKEFLIWLNCLGPKSKDSNDSQKLQKLT